MQVTETEIFLPFDVKNLQPPGSTLSTYATGLIALGAGILLSILHLGLLLSIVLIAAGILLLISPILIAQTNKQISRRFVRINHEGILLAPTFSTAVQWNDISTITLSTWTYLGHSVRLLHFVPRDPEAMIVRLFEQRAKHMFSRLLAKINMALYHLLHMPPPLSILQSVSPIPLEELLALIQERFACELRENRVTILR